MLSGTRGQKQWHSPVLGISEVSHISALDSSIPLWLQIAQVGFCHLQSVESALKDGLHYYPLFIPDEERGSQR